MKRKILFISGIVIMIIGIGIFLYPIITQAISAKQQKQLMQEVKNEILQNIISVNSALPADDPDGSDISGDIAEDITEPADSEVSSETADAPSPSTDLLADLEEVEPTEEVALDKSKLSGQKCVGIITIEDIGIVYAVVEGIDKSQIAVAIGHFPDSAGIGKNGNCALAGHSGGHLGKYFKDIHKLKIGAPILLTDLKGTEYTYYVIESFVCDPTDYYVVEDLDTEGKFLTLVTCTENGSKRWIIRAQCTDDPTKIKGTK